MFRLYIFSQENSHRRGQTRSYTNAYWSEQAKQQMRIQLIYVMYIFKTHWGTFLSFEWHGWQLTLNIYFVLHDCTVALIKSVYKRPIPNMVLLTPINRAIATKLNASLCSAGQKHAVQNTTYDLLSFIELFRIRWELKLHLEQTFTHNIIIHHWATHPRKVQNTQMGRLLTDILYLRPNGTLKYDSKTFKGTHAVHQGTALTTSWFIIDLHCLVFLHGNLSLACSVCSDTAVFALVAVNVACLTFGKWP